MTTTTYETDIVVWANEQAALLRAGRFAALDIVHLAEEIEDVGKSEQRELASRLAVLLAHLLKWRYQPDFRSKSWQATIRVQRKSIAAHLDDTPSLKISLNNSLWLTGVWADALNIAIRETGQTDFPENPPWPMSQVLAPDFFPD